MRKADVEVTTVIFFILMIVGIVLLVVIIGSIILNLDTVSETISDLTGELF